MEREAKTTIDEDGAGTALMEFLVRRFSYLDRARWERAIADGSLSLNGEPCSPDRILAPGDLVRFAPAETDEPETDDRFSVVYENERMLIVDKPPNLPAHPGGRYFKRTLWYLLRRRCEGARIVTRLDRETSGLVLVAKDSGEARRLHLLHQAGRIGKRYLALVHGTFPATLEARGVLIPDDASPVRKKRAFIAESDARFGAASAAGESCETHFELVRADGRKSLVRARLLTGRTHQIRATLRSLGYPVVGDKLYGLDDALFLRFIDGTLDDDDRARLELPFQALHCARLTLEDDRGTPIAAETPPPFAF